MIMYVNQSTAPVIFWIKSLVYRKLTGILLIPVRLPIFLVQILEFVIWLLLSHFACRHVGIMICASSVCFPFSCVVFHGYVAFTSVH